MIGFIIRRIVLMIPTVIIVSVISFVVIQAPPGDFVSTYISRLESSGEIIDQEIIEAFKVRYGATQPLYVQYFKWCWNILRGNLGVSWEWNQPVKDLILDRLPWSLLVSFIALLFIYTVGIPIGVLSATRQYSLGDYVCTFMGFIGLAIPNFLFALVLLWIYFIATGSAALGLFSLEFATAPWSFAKLVDLLKHLVLPGIVIGTAGTAGLIRIMRANLLDELRKAYVITARAKGLPETKLLFKYPFRVAINPIVSTIGWTLPNLVNGELLTSLVLGLPTIAPIFLSSLLMQDMYLAGSIVFILSMLTVIGTLVSDILLAWVDPRIREAV